VAHSHLKREQPGQVLQSTALVHETYLRLAGRQPLQLENRAHFFAVASQLMRQILVDYARRRRATKRDPGSLMLALDEADRLALPKNPDVALLALDDALNGLSAMDVRQSHIVELRFFGGLSINEIARVLDISPATIKREWTTARAWLYREMARA
jgi:RNA polymerase sigma factor (TIGR02999 family)